MSDSDFLRPTLTSDRLSELTDSPTLRPTDFPTLTDSLTDSRPTLTDFRLSTRTQALPRSRAGALFLVR